MGHFRRSTDQKRSTHKFEVISLCSIARESFAQDRWVFGIREGRAPIDVVCSKLGATPVRECGGPNGPDCTARLGLTHGTATGHAHRLMTHAFANLLTPKPAC
jgi:hypothetical protein